MGCVLRKAAIVLVAQLLRCHCKQLDVFDALQCLPGYTLCYWQAWARADLGMLLTKTHQMLLPAANE